MKVKLSMASLYKHLKGVVPSNLHNPVPPKYASPRSVPCDLGMMALKKVPSNDQTQVHLIRSEDKNMSFL